jgi:hypothetical protein
MTSALEHVLSVASEFPITDVVQTESGFQCCLTVALPSGLSVPFELEVRPGLPDHLAVKERLPGRLPRRCPERHITPRNEFCLHWVFGDPQPIVDAESARRWWALLWDFLTRQEAAAKLRRWPGPGRAHGKAVRHQDRAERSAAKLGADVLASMHEGQFATRLDQRRGRNRIELRRNGKLVNRIQLPNRTLTDRRAPCLCSQGVQSKGPIGGCEDHAETLASLVDAVHRWADAEKEYFDQLRGAGVTCCRTLDRCPLR